MQKLAGPASVDKVQTVFIGAKALRVHSRCSGFGGTFMAG